MKSHPVRSIHPYWGVRIITGPDAWWLGDDRGPYTMSQSESERIASILNIRSNEMYFIIKAYRSTTSFVTEREVFGRDLPHYRYAAAPFTSLTVCHPPAANFRKLLLPPSHARPGQAPGQRTRKGSHPRRRTC
jgi:hypothetical protein